MASSETPRERESPRREIDKKREHAFLEAVYAARERHIEAYGRPLRITINGIDAYYLEMYFFSEYMGPEAHDGFPSDLYILYDMEVYQSLSLSQGTFVVAGNGGATRASAPRPAFGETRKDPK
jgi:hypothetical protein